MWLISGAHGVLEQNEASFCRAWRAGAKRGSFRARMACAGKTGVISSAHGVRGKCAGKMRVISGAHGVLEQNEAHFGRAWRAGAKRGKFLLRMACAG